MEQKYYIWVAHGTKSKGRVQMGYILLKLAHLTERRGGIKKELIIIGLKK